MDASAYAHADAVPVSVSVKLCRHSSELMTRYAGWSFDLKLSGVRLV